MSIILQPILIVIVTLKSRYYKSPLVSYDVAFTVYLAWVFGFSGILLLPYDLSFSVVTGIDSERLSIVWTFVYWTTFIFAWFLLPIQMEFHSSGSFSFYGKVINFYFLLLIV